MGRPLPAAPLASSTLHVLDMASTKTNGSLAMTGEIVLRNCLTGIADVEPPASQNEDQATAKQNNQQCKTLKQLLGCWRPEFG